MCESVRFEIRNRNRAFGNAKIIRVIQGLRARQTSETRGFRVHTMNVEGMKVAELKEELKRRGLPTHGLKAALAERLTAAVDAENDESAAPTKNDGDDELSAGDAPATTPAPMSEAPQSEDDDVDFLEDAPSGPTSGPPEPTPVPTVVTDAAPTASLEEEPEEEPDYEPEETPTPPPKRPREDPVADDDDAKRPKVTEEPADGAMAPGVENNNNDDNNDVSPPTRALRIDNFVRPFTFNQVRAMLAEFGAFDVDGVDEPVWMNQPVKTHAVVVYAAESSANECKAFLDDKRWPEETGRALRVRYVSLTEAAETVRAAECAKREAEERVAKARMERGNQQRGRAGSDRPQHSQQQRSDDDARWTRTWPRISWRERRRA
jgi:hypothetical protein